MTVLPFTNRPTDREDAVGLTAAPSVTGRFTSPAGGRGEFVGTYRLERLVDQYGLTAAAGVFTGELVGTGEERLGLASRRQVSAVDVVDGPLGRYVCLGPVDVNLLGFLVTMDQFMVTLPLDVAADGSSGRFPRTVAELLSKVVDATAGPDTALDRPDDQGR
jgi:hypothetical protein